jgi:Polyketide cyclase / dehydrase and lipid transport
MGTFENTVTIERPAEDVFAFLADFENVPTWNYAVEETTKTSPGPGRRGDHLPADCLDGVQAAWWVWSQPGDVTSGEPPPAARIARSDEPHAPYRRTARWRTVGHLHAQTLLI